MISAAPSSLTQTILRDMHFVVPSIEISRRRLVQRVILSKSSLFPSLNREMSFGWIHSSNP